MADIFSGLLTSLKDGIDKMVVGTSTKEPPKVGIEVVVAIFFDGTGNNRNNVAQRLIAQHNKANPQQQVNQVDGVRWSGSYPKNTDEASYNSGYSNVSILETLNQKRQLTKQEISVYVEGIGTENNEGDALLGSAIGTGGTGIIPRVMKGIELIRSRMDKIIERRQDAYVKLVTVDVFGFSRGAAAARNFVSFLHDYMPLAERFGTPKATVKIKFTGIFDTVSSYSAGSFDNVNELSLAMKTNPQKVVHLTAGDEYRKNFSLTDITSSLGVGYELTLPGAHSDLGGGYAEEEDESREVGMADRDHYIDLGWYKPAEIPVQHEDVYDPETGYKLYVRSWAVGVRRRLRWDYQFIPLAIMADCARQYGQMDLADLSPNGQFAKYTLGAGHPLLPVQSAIKAQVGQHGGSGRHAVKLLGDTRAGTLLALGPDEVRLLRNRYLHRSAGLGFWSDGRKGMGERRENGRLQRNVYHG